MPLDSKERCRRYRQRKKAEKVAGQRTRVDPETGKAVIVYSVGGIAEAVNAKDRTLQVSAVRETLKKWLDAGIIPASRWESTVRLYSEDEKDLIVKVYRIHKIKPMTTEGISLWLAARWRTP